MLVHIPRNCVTAFQKWEGEGVGPPGKQECWAPNIQWACPLGVSGLLIKWLLKLSWFLGSKNLCHCKVSWMGFKRKVTLYSGCLFQSWCLCSFCLLLPFHKLWSQWHSYWPKALGLGSVHVYKSRKRLYSFNRPFLLLTEGSVSKWLYFILPLMFCQRSKGVKQLVWSGNLELFVVQLLFLNQQDHCG